MCCKNLNTNVTYSTVHSLTNMLWVNGQFTNDLIASAHSWQNTVKLLVLAEILSIGQILQSRQTVSSAKVEI